MRRSGLWSLVVLLWLGAWYACTVEFDPDLIPSGGHDGGIDADGDADADADADADTDADTDADGDGDGDADVDAGSDAGTDGGVQCPAGRTDCDGQCVDLRNDRQNCGECGNVCSGRPCCGSRCSDNCQ